MLHLHIHVHAPLSSDHGAHSAPQGVLAQHLASGGSASNNAVSKATAATGALPKMSMNDASTVSAALAQLGISMPSAPQFAMWSPVATATYGSFGAPQISAAPNTMGVQGTQGVH